MEPAGEKEKGVVGTATTKKGASPLCVALLTVDGGLALVNHGDVLRLTLDGDGVASGFEGCTARRSTSSEAVEHDIAWIREHPCALSSGAIVSH